MTRRLLAVVLFAVTLLVLADARREPADQRSARVALGAIHLYQATLSRYYTRMGVQCRFTPSCSHYGAETIERFGIARGGWLAMQRVVRCGPWTPMGTHDPPPDA